MKICIVALNIVPYFQEATAKRYSGAEVQMAALARAFASKGMSVSFVVADLPQGASLPFPAENAFDSSRGVRGLRFFHPRLSGIFAALARADADVYYQHCAGMITGATAMFCRGKKRVFVYGGGSDSDFSFDQLLINRMRNKLLYRLGIKLADGIVVQNRYQRELCEKNFHRPSRLIPMVIGTDTSDELSSGDKVLWIGPLRKVKGPELFLQLAKRFPDVEFVMIGGAIPSEIDYSVWVMKQAAEIPNVVFTGHIPHAEVTGRLREAAVLVNTSSVEGFPNAYLEAWKYGVPVISFADVDGYIEGEGVGAVCRDLEEMERELRSLLGDPGRRAAMGKRARDLIVSKFSADVLSDEYLAYFRELIEKRSR